MKIKKFIKRFFNSQNLLAAAIMVVGLLVW